MLIAGGHGIPRFSASENMGMAVGDCNGNGLNDFLYFSIGFATLALSPRLISELIIREVCTQIRQVGTYLFSTNSLRTSRV